MWPEYLTVQEPDYIPFREEKPDAAAILRKVYNCYVFAREGELSDTSYRIAVSVKEKSGNQSPLRHITRGDYYRNVLDPVRRVAENCKMIDVGVCEKTKTLIFFFEEKPVEAPHPDVVPRPEGTIPASFDRNKDQVQRTVDELQACIVLMGGRKFSAKELAEMPLGQILFMCAGNEIAAKFGLKSLPRTTPLLT